MALSSIGSPALAQRQVAMAAASVAVVAGIGLLAPPRASALVFEYSELSSTTSNVPTAPAPWLRTTITQAAVNAVDIQIQSLLKGSAEYFGRPNPSDATQAVIIGLNLSPSIPGLSGTARPCSPGTLGCLETTPQAPQFAVSRDNIPISSDPLFSGFDVGLVLGPPPAFLNGTNTITYRLTGTGLTPESFNLTNGPNGRFCSAALFQSGLNPPVTGTSTGSNAIGAPCPGVPPSSVPAPLPLLGAGVAFGLSRRLRRRIASSHAPSGSLGAVPVRSPSS
jgi:hypothetical protein